MLHLRCTRTHVRCHTDRLIFVVVVVVVARLCDCCSSAASNVDIAYPVLSRVSTVVASDPLANLRDPSSPIFDPSDQLWHFFATHIPVENGQDGYSGRLWHFFSDKIDENTTFFTSGIALDTTKDPEAWDSYGTFTASAFLTDNNTWILFYGGVQNGSEAHTENIGMATSNSAFGPWTKSHDNPIIRYDHFDWCAPNSIPARVDEAEPYVIDGKPQLLVKTICENFTALPMIFAPSGSADTWEPPYHLTQKQPVVLAPVTDGSLGFEQSRIYPGPDGFLHMSANDHDKVGRHPHFVARDKTRADLWDLVGYLDLPVDEVTPVLPRGSYPGDDFPFGVPSFFLGFDGEPLRILLYKASWVATGGLA